MKVAEPRQTERTANQSFHPTRGPGVVETEKVIPAQRGQIPTFGIRIWM